MIQAYDSSRWQLIPHTAKAILPYADGRYAWSNSRFPNAAWRYITVLGNPAVDIIDFEPGCVWDPQKLYDWANHRSQAGEDITVYTFRDAVETVSTTLRKFDWHLWLATLDGTVLTEYEGKPLRGCQYTDRNGLYDISDIYDDNWLYPPATQRPAYINVGVAHWSPTNPPWNSTLWGIAAHYGTSVADLMEINHLHSDIIYPGQVIRVN